MTKTINTCLAIGLEIHNPKLLIAKNLLISKYNSVFNSSTHVTLSITPMPEKKLSECMQELEKVFSKRKKVELQLGTLVIEKDSGVFQIPITSTPELMDIHKTLVMLTNTYREGFIREKDSEKLASDTLPPESVDNIQKYGYERVMNKFHPQISLGKISLENNFEKIESELQPMLTEIVNKKVVVEELYAVFYEDGNDQNKMKTIWEKTYYL